MNRIPVLEIAKVAGANLASWLGTAFTLQQAHMLVAMGAGVGSMAVSAATIWWIRKQAQALAASVADKQKPKSHE